MVPLFPNSKPCIPHYAIIDRIVVMAGSSLYEVIMTCIFALIAVMYVRAVGLKKLRSSLLYTSAKCYALWSNVQ